MGPQSSSIYRWDFPVEITPSSYWIIGYPGDYGNPQPFDVWSINKSGKRCSKARDVPRLCMLNAVCRLVTLNHWIHWVMFNMGSGYHVISTWESLKADSRDLAPERSKWDDSNIGSFLSGNFHHQMIGFVVFQKWVETLKGSFSRDFPVDFCWTFCVEPAMTVVLNGGNNGRRRLFIAAFAQLGKPLSGALCCVSLVALGLAQCGVVTLWIIMGYMWIYHDISYRLIYNI
jgi:hypothetical protein